MARLGVIVPYRDRKEQLDTFIPYLEEFFSNENINDYVIIIVEQSEDKEFNRGALLNIGFLEAESLGCDYVAFHDLDMLPVNADYSYTDTVYQLAQEFKPISTKIPYDYLGGVTLFPMELFRKIGGYSNEYWGWGYEDNDLLLRCLESGLCLDYVTFNQPSTCGPALLFDSRSYVEFERPFNFKRSCLFYVDFILDKLPVDIKEAHDEASIFSIPGLDITLAYDSFGTYKFELFDTYEDVYSIHTEKMPPMHCKVIVYYDHENNQIKFTLNDQIIGVKPLRSDRHIKVVSDKMYLGVGNPVGDKKQFYGKIFKFVALNSCTEDTFDQVFADGIEVIDKEEAAVWYESTGYDSSEDILIDQSGHGRDGKVSNCELVDVQENLIEAVPVPLRRKGTYRLQRHGTNGAEDGHWKSWSTRVNQERYYNRTINGSEKEKDGLINIRRVFRWSARTESDNVIFVKAYNK